MSSQHVSDQRSPGWVFRIVSVFLGHSKCARCGELHVRNEKKRGEGQEENTCWLPPFSPLSTTRKRCPWWEGRQGSWPQAVQVHPTEMARGSNRHQNHTLQHLWLLLAHPQVSSSSVLSFLTSLLALTTGRFYHTSYIYYEILETPGQVLHNILLFVVTKLSALSSRPAKTVVTRLARE